MDKFKRMVSEDISRGPQQGSLDIESLIQGTHKRIRRRRNTRRVLYSSPAIIAISLIFLFTQPAAEDLILLPGDEFILAGLESSSSFLIDDDSAKDFELILYDASVEYLTDDQVYILNEELAELLSDEELEDFYTYLEEV